MAGFFVSILNVSLLAAPVSPEPAPRGAPSDDSVHRQRAEAWLTTHGVEWSEKLSFDDVLNRTHARIPLGIFELYAMPEDLANDDWLPEIKKAVGGLLAIQETWNDWIPPGSEGRKASAFKKDAKTVDKWFQGLRTRELDDAEALVGKNLAEAVGGSKKEVQAVEDLAAFMCGGGTLGEMEVEPTRLVLAPTRADFVEMTALLGLVEPRQQPYFWIDSTVVWTHADYHGTRIIALQFGTGSRDDYTASISMTAKNPEALAQHVAHLGAMNMLDAYFGDRMEPMIALGLANDLVISVYDQADTRIDGDLSARSKAARSVFVAGGNPSGGSLAPEDANSRWRSKRGKGFFVDVLGASQKAGAKEARERWEKLASFMLMADDGSGNHVHRAPILGTGNKTLPPPAFTGDYLEFIRAYRSAFLHWLIESGDGSKNSSRERFGELARAIAHPGEASLIQIFEQVYGVPLSAETGPELFEGKQQTLEGRFLDWLASQ